METATDAEEDAHWAPNEQEEMPDEEAVQEEQEVEMGSSGRRARSAALAAVEESFGENPVPHGRLVGLRRLRLRVLLRGRTEQIAPCQRCKPHWSKGSL